MRIAACAALALAVPTAADARPITMGASLGRIQSKANADGEANDTYQLFGRIGLTSRLGAQLELQKIEDTGIDVRSVSALLAVELADSTHWMPLLVAGIGLDHARAAYSTYEASGYHIEGGLGLEYRADGGLVIGADVRLGGHSTTDTKPDPVALYMPYDPLSGEYRSARLYAAIRF